MKQTATIEQLEHISTIVEQRATNEWFLQLIATVKQKATIELEHISAIVEQKATNERFQQLAAAVKQKATIEQLKHTSTRGRYNHNNRDDHHNHSSGLSVL